MIRPDLPVSVLRYVRMFVIRRRLAALATGACRAAAAGICFMLAACLLDRMLRLPSEARMALLAANVLAAAWPLSGPVLRLLRWRIDWLEAARLLERENPAFGQRLETVVSQMVDAPSRRASGRMLAELAGQIAAEAQADRAWRGLQLRPLARAAAAAVWATAALIALWRVPWLGLDVLARRHLAPWRPIAPVTRTRIEVEAPSRLAAGEALAVRAVITGTPVSAAELLTSLDRRSWTRLSSPAAGGVCEWRLTGIDRDLWFAVSAGDAETPVRRVAVLHPPAVLEMRATLRYPPYARRPDQRVVLADGVIDVPAGTRVELSLTASEPLRSAAVIWGGERLAMTASPADGANVWRVEAPARRNTAADVELVSEAGLTARLQAALTVRVRWDREPVVRMIQPADHGCAEADRALAVEYQAGDDYGLAALWLNVQVNASPPVVRAIDIVGDPRWQQGRAYVEPSLFGAAPGDVLNVSVGAADSGGRKVTAESRTVLLLPGHPSSASRTEAACLRTAQRLAEDLAGQLEQAGRAFDALAGAAADSGPDAQTLRLGAVRAAGSVAQNAWLVHHALLRACFRAGSARDARHLAGMVDRVRVLSWTAERWAAEADSSSAAQADAAEEAATRVRKMAGTLKQMADAAEAALLLNELEALRSAAARRPRDRAAAEISARLLQRAERDLTSRAAAIAPGDGGDVGARLRQCIAAAQALREEGMPDLAAAARTWAQAVARGTAPKVPLVERLLSAAAVEALRPDSSPIHARDLRLAARAALRLQNAAGEKTPATQTAVALSRYADAVTAVCREHELRHAGRRSGDYEQFAGAAAAAARAQLQRWAGQTLKQMIASGSDAELDDLIFAANALMIAGDRTGAEAIDQRLSGLTASRPPADRSAMRMASEAMRLVFAIDEAQAAKPHPAATQELAADIGARLTALEREADLREQVARCTDAAPADAGAAMWSEPLRRRAARLACIGRLALSPALASVIRDTPAESPLAGTRPLDDLLPALRQWGAPAARPIPPHAREGELAEYQEQLKVYFEAIGRAQERSGRKN